MQFIHARWLEVIQYNSAVPGTAMVPLRKPLLCISPLNLHLKARGSVGNYLCISKSPKLFWISIPHVKLFSFAGVPAPLTNKNIRCENRSHMSPTIPRPTLASSLVDALQYFIQPTSKKHKHATRICPLAIPEPLNPPQTSPKVTSHEFNQRSTIWMLKPTWQKAQSPLRDLPTLPSPCLQ